MMRHLCWIVLTILQIYFLPDVLTEEIEIQNPGVETVWIEEGENADLPCDISLPEGDRINMILWFKDSIDVPIYSLDARNVKDLSDGTHLAISDVGNRCYFVVHREEDKKSHLTIHKVTLEDEGIYKCRVDFFNSPTKHFRVNLTLITLPTLPSIMTDQGIEVTGETVGPYREEGRLHLICSVQGGKPKPRISWWLNGEPLNGSVVESAYSNQVSSRLLIHSIPRYYNRKYLECQTNLGNTSTVLSKTIRLDVYVKPTSVRITLGYSSLSSGKSQQLICETTGSHPAPNIYWLLDGETIIKQAAIGVTDNPDVDKSHSSLMFRPDATDNGKSLTCRCENPEFPGYILEDKKTIEVTYPPIPKISLMSKTNFNSVIENDDVSMQCIVDANPSANAIVWYHNDEVIKKSSSSKTDLKLSSVTKESAGDYVCEAFNDEGSNKSKPKTLKILYAPVCHDTAVSQTILALKKELVILHCEVESESEDEALQFFWTYNNSKDVLPVPAVNYESIGRTSVLKFTPNVDSDFGTFGCWAQNSIGKQQTPCVFRVVPAKRPERPGNCTIQNETPDQLKVSCEPGFDGGSRQYFLLEVRLSTSGTAIKEIPTPEYTSDHLSDQAGNPSGEIDTNPPLYSFKGEVPTFDLLSLDPGYCYFLMIYAVNMKGRSDPVIITQEIKSTKLFNKVLPPPSSSSSEIGIIASSTITVPTTYVLAVVLLIILVLFLIVIIASVLACKRREADKRETMERELNSIRLMFSDNEIVDSSHVNFETEF